ncbi:MAG: PAS domain S-box protein, partial [Candidatus Bathyarchaeia archaeon]
MVNNNKLRILHVDDDCGFLEVAKQILELEGKFEVETAASVDEAFLKLADGVFDAVVSDYEMPGKNGLDFLGELKENKADVPFILFTGKGREEVAIRALNLGADGYHNKQGSPETVYGELAHLVRLAVERSKSTLKITADALAFENVENAIVTADQTQTITSWNRAAEVVFGWSAKEAIGKKLEDLFVPIQIDVSFQEVACAIQEKGRFCSEVAYKNRKGQLRYGELTVISQLSSCGKPVGSTIVCHDITEHKKAEEELRLSRQKLMLHFERTPLGVIEWDINFKVTNWNPAAER